MLLAIAFVLANGAAVADAPARSSGPLPIAVDAARLQPEFWIGRLPGPDRLLMSGPAITEQNERLLREDASLHALSSLPESVTAEDARAWLIERSRLPQRPLWNEDRSPVGEPQRTALLDSIALDTIDASVPLVFGLVVARADLRTFPTRARVFTSSDDTDIDRFQESALFPGTPVAIVHESRDRNWWFVVSPQYRAWIEKSRVREPSA